MPPAREAGINADYQHIGDFGSFYEFASECGSCVLIDNRDRQGFVELRHRNSRMILQQRDYYPDWEGKWRDCPHEGKPQTPERMFDVLTSGYRSDVNVWIYFGNEPARGNARPGEPVLGNIRELIDDIVFYVKVIELFIAAKIRVVVMNIQVVELTPEKLPYYEPIFDLCNRYPQYVAFGIHEYFTMILPLGVGSGDWTKLLNWGEWTEDKWAPPAGLVSNAVNAHIGKDVWIRDQIKAKYPNVRMFKNEMGFDRINNLPQIGALDAANGGRKIRGLDTVIALLHRYYGGDAQIIAAKQIEWMCKNVTEAEVQCFYNWSTQDEWLDYSCAPYGGFRQYLREYNNKVRLGQLPTQETPNTPPPTKRTALQIATDMQKLVNELKAI